MSHTENAGEWIALGCISPAVVYSGYTQIQVNFTYSITTSYSLRGICGSGGSATAKANESIQAYLYGGTPSGPHGTVQLALFSHSVGCAGSTSGSPSFSGNLSTGFYSYNSNDYFDYHFQVFVDSSSAAVGTGSSSSSSASLSFTITQYSEDVK